MMDPLDFQNTDEPGHKFKTFKIKFNIPIGDHDSWILLPVLTFEQSLCELAARSLVL